MSGQYPTSALNETQISPASDRSQTRRLTQLLLWLAVFVLFGLGLGLRLYDLTDPPIDFHPTRQLRGAIIARGIYYEMLPDADPQLREDAIAFGNSTGQYEPSILEEIVATTYLALGTEQMWVARLYTSLFWVIGGLAVFFLARRMAAEEMQTGHLAAALTIATALIASGYYLLLPFGVQASRAFQPDPFMVMWLILALFSLYRWSQNHSWVWAVLAGLLAGMAVLIKIVAAYIAGGAAVGVVLYSLGLKRSLRSAQVWIMAILMIAPSFFYYVVGRGGRASEYFSGWTVSLSHLLLEPATYVRWFSLLQDLMGLTVIMLALTGLVIARPRNRALLLGGWLGYLIYGLFLPYQMYTHNYYHEQLIPILAISMVPVLHLVLDRISQQAKHWQAVAVFVALIAAGYMSWAAILPQYRDDYRHEPAYWQEVGDLLPTDGKILALTQDYGYRLMYYGWRKVILWPTRGELNLSELRGGGDKDLENFFAKKSEGMDYFLITSFNQFNDQPELKKYLNQNFPVYAEGGGYLIYDLAHPLTP
jgi:uncharacterized membrane-anchored protein YitT (DUF2179 family)